MFLVFTVYISFSVMLGILLFSLGPINGIPCSSLIYRDVLVSCVRLPCFISGAVASLPSVFWDALPGPPAGFHVYLARMYFFGMLSLLSHFYCATYLGMLSLDSIVGFPHLGYSLYLRCTRPACFNTRLLGYSQTCWCGFYCIGVYTCKYRRT